MNTIKASKEKPTGSVALLTVVTNNVLNRLTESEIKQAFRQFQEKMKVSDPKNPDMWVINLNGHKIWGILDLKSAPSGEDVLTILFPEDY